LKTCVKSSPVLSEVTAQLYRLLGYRLLHKTVDYGHRLLVSPFRTLYEPKNMISVSSTAPHPAGCIGAQVKAGSQAVHPCRQPQPTTQSSARSYTRRLGQNNSGSDSRSGHSSDRLLIKVTLPPLLSSSNGDRVQRHQRETHSITAAPKRSGRSLTICFCAPGLMKPHHRGVLPASCRFCADRDKSSVQ
jgi:hypothetical protein